MSDEQKALWISLSSVGNLETFERVLKEFGRTKYELNCKRKEKTILYPLCLCLDIMEEVFRLCTIDINAQGKDRNIGRIKAQQEEEMMRLM
jgi:hypothetical protein